MKRITHAFFLSIFLLLAGTTAWLWHVATLPDSLPIHKVDVVGELHFTDPAVIQDTVLPFVSHGFFNVDITHAKKALLSLPAIKDISITRHWPDRVSIHTTEYHAFAKWNQNDWLTPEGATFHSNFVPADRPYPHFIALPEDIPTLLKSYPTWHDLFASHQLHISTVASLSVDSWSITTDNNEQFIFTESQTMTTLPEFLKAYPKLREKHPEEKLLYVDMRYNNGFAVRWVKP